MKTFFLISYILYDKMMYSCLDVHHCWRERVYCTNLLKGTVQFIGPEYIVIENNGIGYQISAPNPFYLF